MTRLNSYSTVQIWRDEVDVRFGKIVYTKLNGLAMRCSPELINSDECDFGTPPYFRHDFLSGYYKFGGE
jgi:hypothetical protein